MDIEENRVVSIHYTLTNDDGDMLDSSEGRGPLDYLQGAGNVIPGLEQALVGKTVGDHVEVTVQPEDGYGHVNPEFVQQVPRTAFEGIDDIDVGMQFEARGPDGEAALVMVTAITADSVTIDGNHPLAGAVLHFDVNVEEVREATEEELEHGHVHTPGHTHVPEHEHGPDCQH